MTTRKKCVDVAKLIAKHRDSLCCQKCGRTQGRLDGAHIFPETYHLTCADPDNIIALCFSCHIVSKNSWHQSPLENADWFRQKWPGRYEMLLKRATPSRPIKKYEWDELLIKLKLELKTLTS